MLRMKCFTADVFLSFAIAFAIFGVIGFAVGWSGTGVIWTVAASGIYIVWSFLGVLSDNASDQLWKASALDKKEWLNMISADSRTRFTVGASLISAIIVSLNAWITRWENQNKMNAALAAAAAPPSSSSLSATAPQSSSPTSAPAPAPASASAPTSSASPSTTAT